MRSAVLGRGGRELRDAFVELEATHVEIVVSRRTRLARRIRIGREVRDVDDGSPEVRSNHASQEIARRDCDVEGVEGLEPIGPVAPQLRRLPGDRQAGEARRLLAEALIELEQVVPRTAHPIIVRRVHLERGTGDVDEVQSQQGEVVVVNHVRAHAFDEFVVMPPDARGGAEDPCAEGLEPTREGRDRVTDDAAVSPVVEVGPPPFERQGGGRVFHVNLVALRHQRLGKVADMVRVPSEVVRWIEGRGHDEFEGLHLIRPSDHGVVKPWETIGVVALERPHSPRDLTLHRKILTPSSWKQKERTWTYNLYVSQRRGSDDRMDPE